MVNYDYSEFQDEKPNDALAELSKLGDRQAELEEEILEEENKLKKLKDLHKEVSQQHIPELMDQLGLQNFTTTSGTQISVTENVRASIPVARKPEAFQWLRDHGNAGLIKRMVSVEFGRGEDEKASELSKALAETFELVKDEANIHHSTLASFVKSQLESGVDIPLDLFGVFRQRVAKTSIKK